MGQSSLVGISAPAVESMDDFAARMAISALVSLPWNAVHFGTGTLPETLESPESMRNGSDYQTARSHSQTLRPAEVRCDIP